MHKAPSEEWIIVHSKARQRWNHAVRAITVILAQRKVWASLGQKISAATGLQKARFQAAFSRLGAQLKLKAALMQHLNREKGILVHKASQK